MTSPTNYDALLAVAKAAQEFIDEYRDMNGGEEPDDPITRRLAEALANLEGGDPGGKGTVAEMGGTFNGPDSVEWLRKQRGHE